MPTPEPIPHEDNSLLLPPDENIGFSDRFLEEIREGLERGRARNETRAIAIGQIAIDWNMDWRYPLRFTGDGAIEAFGGEIVLSGERPYEGLRERRKRAVYTRIDDHLEDRLEVGAAYAMELCQSTERLPDGVREGAVLSFGLIPHYYGRSNERLLPAGLLNLWVELLRSPDRKIAHEAGEAMDNALLDLEQWSERLPDSFSDLLSILVYTVARSAPKAE